MSRRKIKRDPVQARREQYEPLDGETMGAIVEALEFLNDEGHYLGPKLTRTLQKRREIKQTFPKN